MDAAQREIEELKKMEAVLKRQEALNAHAGKAKKFAGSGVFRIVVIIVGLAILVYFFFKFFV